MVAGHRDQLPGVERHEGVEARGRHREHRIGHRLAVGTGLNGRGQPVLHRPPPITVETVGTVVVPAGRIVGPRLPRMADPDQARGVTTATPQQEPQAGGGPLDHLAVDRFASPHQLGHRMAVHGRLGDRRVARSPPQVLVEPGLADVVHVGHEPRRRLGGQRHRQLAAGPVTVTKGQPHQDVEARIP